MTTYNKVTLNGDTLMDISDTTAVASDVASGKYFYTAGGVKTAGTASGQPSLQTKTVTPTNSQQTVTADNGYDGLSSVTVNAIPSQYIVPSGTKSITANGTGIDVTNYASVDVAVSTGGGSSNYKETVDVVYNNQAGNTFMAIPLSDVTKDNYVVSWAVVETGVYSNGVLTMDSTPTIPSGQNMPFTGVSMLLSAYQKFTGKTISTNRTDYGVISTNAVVRSSISSYALTEGLTKTSTGLSMKGQYAFGKANYYIKYRCIVYGWDN